MANRYINNNQTVTQVIPEADSMFQSLAPIAADVGQQIIKKSQEAKIVENLSAAQLDINKLSEEYQIKYQGDPFNEQGQKDFNARRQEIIDGYGKQISPLFGGAWKDTSRKLVASNSLSTQAWAYKQAMVNTKASIANSMDSNFKSANIMGRQGISEAEALLNFATTRDQLREFANENLGETSANELLKDYEKDYLKSYLAGIAETDPERAGRIMANPELADKFTTDERDEFGSAIKKSIALKKLETTLQQTEMAGEVFDIVNDENSDYYTKRLTIDRMELEGKITTSTAAKARRVLKSENDLDAITNTPVMADIITRIYDLNALQETNSEGYLVGVQNIREEIMQKQTDGELTAPDAKKLNNQLKTLTSAKLSDATQRVGYEFYDANQKFEMLPPEFRGRATRELFYKTHGKEGVTKEAYDIYADDIISTINHERRTQTLKRLNDVQASDADFLKANNITMDEVAQTARNRNMTEAQVIQAIKAKLINQGKAEKKKRMSQADQNAAIVDLYGPDGEPVE